MDDIERVKVGESFQKLVDKRFNELWIYAIGCLLEHFEEVVLNVLKHKIDDSFFAKSFFEFDDIAVLKHF